MVSYVPVAKAIEKVQNESYKKIVCGGFSAGCDMLILQSPWIPILKDHAEDLVSAVRQKNIELKIFCGTHDEDCLPMAKQLYEIANRKGIHVEFVIQEGNRHQFPKESFVLKDSL